MTTPQTYDAIVIGAGQSGGPLSTTLANAGWKTAIIEKKYVGGSCINEGCTPTKTMAASARVAHLVQRAGDYGVNTGPVSVDLAKVRQRKRDIVDMFRSGSRGHIEKTEGTDLIMGEAKFVGPKTIAVNLNEGGKRQLTAELIIINTGTRPNFPPIDGLKAVPALTSISITELDSAPEHLLIIGGGYIGLEFGQMFSRFGSRVTIIQRGSQLLAREDTDVAEEVANILREDGLEVLLNADASQVTQTAGGHIQLTVKTPEAKRTLTGSHLLVAAGRVPNTDMLNLPATGVKTDKRGFIPVNARLQTNVPNIYALGDVNGGPAFTHISYDDYRILKANLLRDGAQTTTDRLVPYTVFIDPQLGRVGLNEKQARAEHRAYCVAKMPMSHVARALETDETRGLMKALVDPETDQIMGASILGVDGGEIMAVLQMAMMGQVPFNTIRDGVFAHPTLAESLNNLFSALDDEQRKTCHYPNR